MTTAQELKDMLEQDVRTLLSEVGSFLENNRIISSVEDIPIPAKARDLAEAVDQLVAETDSRSQSALRAITALGALNAQLAYLDARLLRMANLNQIQQTVTGAWNSLKSYIQPILQSISQHLWQLISQLLTLKEWSIAGDTGVNAFGLTGSVQLELTFEK